MKKVYSKKDFELTTRITYGCMDNNCDHTCSDNNSYLIHKPSGVNTYVGTIGVTDLIRPYTIDQVDQETWETIIKKLDEFYEFKSRLVG